MCLSSKRSFVISAVFCLLTRCPWTTSCETKQTNSQPSSPPSSTHPVDFPYLRSTLTSTPSLYFLSATCNRHPLYSSASHRSQWIPSSLAEIASFQMEYAYLGKITGKKAHVDRVSVVLLPLLTLTVLPQVTTVSNIFHNTNLSLSGGMYPTYWGLHDGRPSNRASYNPSIHGAH